MDHTCCTECALDLKSLWPTFLHVKYASACGREAAGPRAESSFEKTELKSGQWE